MNFIVLLAALSCGFLGPAHTAAEPTHPEPVVIDNCGMTLQVKCPPRKALAINQNPTEIMLALGLEDHMDGTAYLDDEILPELRERYEKVPVIAEKYPSKEVVLGRHTDFIYAGFPGAFTERTVGERQELLEMGILTYVTPSLCSARRETPMSVDEVLEEITDIGRLFGVEEKARELTGAMRAKLVRVQERVGRVAARKRVFFFDTWGTTEETPFTAGCCGPVGLLIELAGGRNIFSDIVGRMAQVNWEVVVERDPEVIVLNDTWWSPAERKKEWLWANPALSRVAAVREGRFVVVPASATMPGVRFSATVERFAEAFHPEKP